MTIVAVLKEITSKAIAQLYQKELNQSTISINTTKPEFDGDYTLVLFSFVKELKKNPEQMGKELGDYLVTHHSDLITSYNVIKGFLNLSIADHFWTDYLHKNYINPKIGWKAFNDKTVLIEYSSPNTNKPLHLGHLRNNFLGWSVAEILKTQGYNVKKCCIYNDRGIHICKSMVAWLQFANGATPDIMGMKGDHFVGDFYVLFGEAYKEQIAELITSGKTKEEAEKEAPIMQAAQNMLLEWEQGNPKVISLWKKMNSWVYEGFNETYTRIGSDFDKNYYESETYLLGKSFVEEGLQKGIFFKKEDGSVWIDLSDEGLDEKLVLRKDGTSVYITQDLGLAEEKYQDFHYEQSGYVIADEQNYHMKVLKLILQKLQRPYADGIHHLSYGMVELPSGRMKTREGTVVDADDLLDELLNVAADKTEELGKVKDFNVDELNDLYNIISLGALKFFILRVDPKKRIVFNPEESIDFQGFTGPFIQYTHARIKSILRNEVVAPMNIVYSNLLPLEKELLVLLEQYELSLEQAANEHNPSLLAIYAFNIAKTFNSFYAAHSIRNAENAEKKDLRLKISALTANTIASCMSLLGIRVPERM